MGNNLINSLLMGGWKLFSSKNDWKLYFLIYSSYSNWNTWLEIHQLKFNTNMWFFKDVFNLIHRNHLIGSHILVETHSTTPRYHWKISTAPAPRPETSCSVVRRGKHPRNFVVRPQRALALQFSHRLGALSFDIPRAGSARRERYLLTFITVTDECFILRQV